jgi:hypothetical protein
MSEPSQMTPLKDALLSAKFEIEHLRRRNELLSAKVETMDLLGAMLRAQVSHSSAVCGPDVIWQLQRELDRLNKPPEAGSAGLSAGSSRTNPPWNQPHEEGEGPTAAELGAAVRRAGLQGKGMSGA